MKLIVATHNQSKLEELSTILSGKFSKLLSLSDINLDIEIEETGSTFLQNALIKAEKVCRLTSLPALADDSGLMVDALGGAPGIYSARYCGPPYSDECNNKFLLESLKGETNRKAKFVCAVALCYPNGEYITAEGQVCGTILNAPKGHGGFGYDSLFFSTELQKTFAQATADEKNSVSHRFRALEALLEKMPNAVENNKGKLLL